MYKHFKMETPGPNDFAMMEELLTRIPDFEVDEGNVVWAGGGYVRRPLSVPFTVI